MYSPRKKNLKKSVGFLPFMEYEWNLLHIFSKKTVSFSAVGRRKWLRDVGSYCCFRPRKNCDMDLNEYGREWHLWYETIEATSPFIYFNDKDIY